MTRCAGSMLLTYADMSFTQFCTELFVRPHQRSVMQAESPKGSKSPSTTGRHINRQAPQDTAQLGWLEYGSLLEHDDRW